MNHPILLTSLLAVLCTAFHSAADADGELRVVADTPAKVVQLSNEGSADWAHWGRIHGVTMLNRKADARPVITFQSVALNEEKP